MAFRKTTEQQILKELRKLAPGQWAKILSFIVSMRRRSTPRLEKPGLQALSAKEILNSDLVGLWSDRPEVENSLSFARQLRRNAEHVRRRAYK